MSTTYQVDGWVEVRIRIDDTYNTSQSSTHDDIANMVLDKLICNFGECQILGHKLRMRELG